MDGNLIPEREADNEEDEYDHKKSSHEEKEKCEFHWDVG
jgi:hypothetical protein